MILVKKLILVVCGLLLFGATARSAEIQSRFAKFGDIKIHYLDRGKGDQALVFVHGWTCRADFWRPQLDDFPSLRVIAVDLAGHGESDKPHLSYTMDYLARSIEAVLEDAKVKHAVLVGHSMGTPVVRQFYRLFPDQTAGIVIVDGALRMLFPKEQMEQFIAPIRTNYKETAPRIVEGIVAQMKDEKLKAEVRTAMLATPDYVGISAMEGMADEKIYSPDKINVPVLALLAKSPFWTPDTETFLRSLAPNLEFVMWDGVSHFLMMEKPQEFDQTVQAFLTTNKLFSK